MPDFLLVDVDHLVTVVNVKPADRLTDPKVAQTLQWAGGVFERRGWRSEIWSGTDETTLSNVRFLAGYRRPALIDPHALAAVAAAATDGQSIEELERRVAPTHAREAVRPALLHLVWTGVLVADLTAPLGPTTVIGRAA